MSVLSEIRGVDLASLDEDRLREIVEQARDEQERITSDLASVAIQQAEDSGVDLGPVRQMLIRFGIPEEDLPTGYEDQDYWLDLCIRVRVRGTVPASAEMNPDDVDSTWLEGCLSVDSYDLRSAITGDDDFTVDDVDLLQLDVDDYGRED